MTLAKDRTVAPAPAERYQEPGFLLRGMQGTRRTHYSECFTSAVLTAGGG